MKEKFSKLIHRVSPSWTLLGNHVFLALDLGFGCKWCTRKAAKMLKLIFSLLDMNEGRRCEFHGIIDENVLSRGLVLPCLVRMGLKNDLANVTQQMGRKSKL